MSSADADSSDSEFVRILGEVMLGKDIDRVVVLFESLGDVAHDCNLLLLIQLGGAFDLVINKSHEKCGR